MPLEPRFTQAVAWLALDAFAPVRAVLYDNPDKAQEQARGAFHDQGQLPSLPLAFAGIGTDKWLTHWYEAAMPDEVRWLLNAAFPIGAELRAHHAALREAVGDDMAFDAALVSHEALEDAAFEAFGAVERTLVSDRVSEPDLAIIHAVMSFDISREVTYEMQTAFVRLVQARIVGRLLSDVRHLDHALARYAEATGVAVRPEHIEGLTARAF